ncbi:MAG: TetR/AcrR family transcriptional regulator [Solirubrobacterales bacterium]
MSPTQRERTEATTARLVGAGRELFAADGYAATSLDAVVAKAGVTKGALYHHFGGKRELFAAVFAAEQARLLETVAAAAADQTDPWRAFEGGCVAFVAACQEPGVQRIFLLDAPVALGWETIRSLESRSLELMVAGIEGAIEAGRISPREPRQLAHLLFGAICESAMVVARAPDQGRALSEATEELRELLRALAS